MSQPYVVDAGTWARLTVSLRRALVACYQDNCFNIAKGAAYSGVLAFFPVLTFVAALLAEANAQSVFRLIARLLFQVVPPGSGELVDYLFKTRGQKPLGLLFGAAALSLWGASGFLVSLMEGFRAAYRIPAGRPFFKERRVAVVLVCLIAVPALLASLLILFGVRIERYALAQAGMPGNGAEIRFSVILVSRVVRYVIALVAITVVNCAIYYIAPNRTMRLKDVWRGAVVATSCWLISTSAFGWYVRNFSNYSLMYGSIGAMIALLVWMYLLAWIILYGCEFNAQREFEAQNQLCAASVQVRAGNPVPARTITN